MPMKVLAVNAVNGIASTGRTVADLALGMKERGFEYRVAYTYGNPPEEGFIVGSRYEWLLHALGSRVFGKQAYFSRRGTERLIGYINTYSPDVVHLHNLHSNFVNLPMLLTYLADSDTATVLHLHDCWFFTGKCCYYTSDGCDRWLTGCGSCPRLKKDNPSWFVDATAQMWADKARLYDRIPRLAVIGVSDWITGEAQRSMLADARILRTVHNWVDLDTFVPVDESGLRERLGLRDKFVILGVATRWSGAGGTADKGIADFIELGKMLESQQLGAPEVDAATNKRFRPELVLVGDLERAVSLPDNIRHVAKTEDIRELAAYYAVADVFFNPSREETFGKVTAEALACGTPAIVYRSTANPEIVGEGCGYVVEPGDLAQVVRSLHQIYDKTKASYASSCREFARTHFDMNDRIDDVISVYEEIHHLGRSR